MKSRLRLVQWLLALLFLCNLSARAQQLNVTSVTPNPVCAGATISAAYSYTLSDQGTVDLYLNGPNTSNLLIGSAVTNGNNGSVIGTIPTNRATGSYTVYLIRVSIPSGTAVISPASSAFTVNARPAPPGVTPLAYCQGATNVPPLTATGQNLNWYAVPMGGNGSTTAPTPPTNSSGTTNYYVSQTTSGCEGLRAALTVTVNPRPGQPSVVSSVSYCQNSTAPSLATAVTSGSNLKWYITLTGGGASTVAPTPPTTSTGTTTYYVSQTNGNGCESDRAAITVTIKPSPAPPAVTIPPTYCQSQPATPLSATPVSGGTLNWFGPTNNSLGSTAPTPPTSAPGTTSYAVTQTLGGCTGTAVTISVTVSARPVVPTTRAVSVCQGTTPVSLTTGVTSGSNLRWYTSATVGTGSTVAPTPPTSSTGTTNYYVSQTNGDGCESDRAVVTYTVTPTPGVPTVSSSPLQYCQNATAVPLTATPDPNATLTYYIVAAGGTPYSSLTPSTNASNNYYVSQTLNKCEGPRATISVVVNALPSRPAVTTPVIYCQFASAASLSATAATNNTLSWYGTQAMGGTASTVAPTPPTTTAGAFTYYVSQRDPNGCESDRATIGVTIDPKPTGPTVIAASACLNSGSYSLAQSITAIGTLKWYTAPTGGPGSTDAPVLPTSEVGSTTYYVSQTTGSGCESDRVAVTFTTNPLPTANLSNDGPLTCTKPGVLLIASSAGSGGLTYRFSTGANQIDNGPTAMVSTAGVYSVTVAGSNGCSTVASTTVTGDQTAPSVTINPSSATLTCANPSATLTAVGTGSVRWNTGAQTAIITVTTGGTYLVTLTGSNGCAATASALVSSEQTAPAIAINPSSTTLSCTNSSVTLTATGSGAVRWSTGQTTPSISVTTAGTYSVSVTSAGGCVATASAEVSNDQTVPTVSISPTSGTLTCASPTLILTANTTAPILRWSNGQTTSSITVNAAGTYSVTATGANGCSATSNSVSIESSQDAPSATLITSGALSCAVTSVTLTANAGSGLSYRFSSGATQVGNGNTATVTVTGTYSVTVTNTTTGCTNTASVVVSQDNSQPTVSIDPTTATLTCGLPTATLTANTSASSLTWSTGQTTNSISVSAAGTYSVTVTNANGCMAMAQATVNGTTDAPTAPTLAASPATTTTNQPITVTASGCTGGTINWTALGGTGQASGNVYTVSQPGNYTLSATCSLNGCTSSLSTPLAVQIRPGGFAITGVSMVNCQLIDEARGQYQVQFTPQYAGQTNSPISFAVVNELAQTTAPAPYSLRLYTDNPVITLVATQAGNGEARFAYNWLASCQSGTSPNQPPTTTGIPAQTILVGQGYQLQLTSYFSDPDGQALSFQASGLPAGLNLSGSVISGTPSQTGVSTVSVTALDPGGLQVSTSFQLTVSPMPVTPPSGFAIVGVSTVSCQVLSAGQRRVTFTPQYAGVSGAPISFSVVNELVATTNPGPYSLNLYTDNPTITLSAQQGATVSTYRYNWLAVCTPAARISAGEAGSLLVVRVLGNPVEGNTAEVEIRGVSGQAVQINLVDLQGKPVHTHRIEQAGAVERVSLSLGASNGVLLLQVSTPTQHQQVKLLRTN